MNISVSEINSFLRCRRSWDLTSASRQSLRHKVTPKMFFVVGSSVHEAIDAQARGDDPFEYFEEYVNTERTNRRETYESIVGTSPWANEMEEFESSVVLARQLVIQYFDRYSIENPLAEQGLKYVATEVPFSIPLGGDVNFVGTFDGIATDIETESVFYLVENKTAGRKPNIELLQTANQFVGYNWAFRRLTGVTPAGTLYNGLLKRIIKLPKMLKSGALSVDKSASVTLKTFMEAIQRGNHDPVKYLEYLEFLQQREAHGDDRFFFREIFTYSNGQLDRWGETLELISQEISHQPVVYPNYTSCEGCLVRDLCLAKDMGEDVDAIKQLRYEVKTYGTMEAVDGVTPDVVGSIPDLLEVLRGTP